MGPLNRRLRALERRVGDRAFTSGGPPLDSEGLPIWDGSVPLTVESYMRAMGFSPDEELTETEVETRDRLSPYAEIFERLDQDATEEDGT